MTDILALSDGVYISVYAAAARYHVTRPTLYRWAARGTVRAAMPHTRRVYVHEADVARVAAHGTRAAHSWQLVLC